MKIFNRVKSLINRYLCRYQKRWVYIHIGWVFLVAQIIALLRAQHWGILFVVLACICFTLSMRSTPNTYFRCAKN